jgi:hypothetical protein
MRQVSTLLLDCENDRQLQENDRLWVTFFSLKRLSAMIAKVDAMIDSKNIYYEKIRLLERSSVLCANVCVIFRMRRGHRKPKLRDDDDVIGYNCQLLYADFRLQHLF